MRINEVTYGKLKTENTAYVVYRITETITPNPSPPLPQPNLYGTHADGPGNEVVIFGQDGGRREFSQAQSRSYSV